MTSQSSSGNVSSEKPSYVGNSKGDVDWKEYLPKSVGSEDSMGPTRVSQTWEKMYALAGMSSASEGERRALRLAVYVYCCKNGTSREGDYAGEFVTANGTVVSASVIPVSTGKMNIRKFMRGNMEESYKALKQTQVMMSDERFLSKVAVYSISAENAFATADWLADCPYFTPTEAKAHNTVFTKSIERARRAREGYSLERVEEARVNDAIKANGPAAESAAVTEW